MMSAKEGAKQRKEIQRQIEAGHRQKAASTLRELREHLRAARSRRNEALGQAKAKCRAERIELRERAHARRKQTLAELRETYARERSEARYVCLARKADVHATARDPIEKAKGEWEAERKYQAELRRIEVGNQERRRQAHRTHAAERRSESDDEVLGNVPESYAALFRRVKRSIKGSSRESRTEAFLRYIEENPGELVAALEPDSDRIVRELEEQQARAERALREAPPSKRRSFTPEDLASVPF
jgi:hypothetical protein